MHILSETIDLSQTSSISTTRHGKRRQGPGSSTGENDQPNIITRQKGNATIKITL